MSTPTLHEACHCWQGGRDIGSSALRGAARVLTGIDHYFNAGFIEEHEAKARADDELLDLGRVLLDAVASSPARSAEEYARLYGYCGEISASRGKSKGDEDDQIDQRIRAAGATLAMPLWGFSLDPVVAKEYGTRFLFRLEGAFTGIAAWAESGEKPEEAEIIGGGIYAVDRIEDVGTTTHVFLRQTRVLEPLPQPPA